METSDHAALSEEAKENTLVDRSKEDPDFKQWPLHNGFYVVDHITGNVLGELWEIKIWLLSENGSSSAESSVPSGNFKLRSRKAENCDVATFARRKLAAREAVEVVRKSIRDVQSFKVHHTPIHF
ncbi:hypothetical protein LTR66_012041 [Elasticomyces elasticus]|nr:hypothetical protein LTR66_012041 [Elasticomyces elasticus]KAK4987704.1 hypothetical protein LTR50_004452 [Elasticomyces elasticus]